jgi:hypothetical protein
MVCGEREREREGGIVNTSLFLHQSFLSSDLVLFGEVYGFGDDFHYLPLSYHLEDVHNHNKCYLCLPLASTYNKYDSILHLEE